jgi:hypothetical protein
MRIHYEIDDDLHRRAKAAAALRGHLNRREPMPRKPDPMNLYQARLDGVAGRIQGALWTANVDQLTALRENMPRLADALDALLVVLRDKPTHLRPLIDDKRGS